MRERRVAMIAAVAAVIVAVSMVGIGVAGASTGSTSTAMITVGAPAEAGLTAVSAQDVENNCRVNVHPPTMWSANGLFVQGYAYVHCDLPTVSMTMQVYLTYEDVWIQATERSATLAGVQQMDLGTNPIPCPASGNYEVEVYVEILFFPGQFPVRNIFGGEIRNFYCGEQ